MFTIVISEKGGAERRETFDKNEINVGRVQGNDLMLPKGNVSKHHARLLYRDGRFIVTDLKSTNGTYVNGRKIAQATIVREGDKIYIGDFVLKLDTGAGASSSPSAADQQAYRPAQPRAQQQQPPPQQQPQQPPAPSHPQTSIPPRQLPRETPAQAGRRLALITLVDRVADVVDVAPLKQSPNVDEQLSAALDRAVRE